MSAVQATPTARGTCACGSGVYIAHIRTGSLNSGESETRYGVACLNPDCECHRPGKSCATEDEAWQDWTVRQAAMLAAAGKG